MSMAAQLALVLEYDRQAILAGELWRLWSAHLVHYSLQHALTDTGAVLVAGLITAQMFSLRALLIAVLMGAALISAGLLLAAPDCLYYRGASGLAVQLAVMAGAGLWRRASDSLPARAILVLLAAALAAKIAAEATGYASGWSGLPADVVVSWQAHLLGAVVGTVFALLLLHTDRQGQSEAAGAPR